MRRIWWKLWYCLAPALILAAVFCPCAEVRGQEEDDAPADYVTYAPGVTEEMNRPEYWLERCKDPGETVMSRQEISQMNQAILEDPVLSNNIWEEKKDRVWYEAETCDPGAAPLQLHIERRSGREALYGICVNHTDIKLIPVEQAVWEDPEDPYFDKYQLSTAGVNTPLLINGKTGDGKFYHVITRDYMGWTLAENIAVCENRDQWLEAQQMELFLVVTAPRLRMEITGVLLTMGNRLRILTSREAAETLPGVNTWGCYVAELPSRTAEGGFTVKYGLIPVSDDVSVGYLNCTRENILRQSFRFLGDAYGWGGMYESVDCSGLVQAVAASFGLMLPRDSWSQSHIPAERISFTREMNGEERKAVLDTLQPGALLYFTGHIMIYLGKTEGEYYVLSAVGSLRFPDTPEGEMEKVRRVIINTLSAQRKNQNTWLQELEIAVVQKNPI